MSAAGHRFVVRRVVLAIEVNPERESDTPEAFAMPVWTRGVTSTISPMCVGTADDDVLRPDRGAALVAGIDIVGHAASSARYQFSPVGTRHREEGSGQWVAANT